MAVGDVQQSIYAWRGSDPKFIKELTNSPDIFEHHVVNINHRCHPSIINYASRLYNPHCPLSETNEIRVYRKRYQGTQIDVTKQLNTSIEQAIQLKLVDSYSQIGILVRNNLSLEFLSNGLKVPFRIFDEDPLAVRNTKTCNLFSQLLRLRFDKNHHINDIIDYLRSFNDFSTSRIPSLRKLLSTISSQAGDELLNKIVEITSKILNENINEHEKELLRSICFDSKSLKHYMPINDAEVQIMTLHKSKGLEFEIVYHLDLYDWVHPKRKFIQGCFDVVYDDWDQELNLHYVGITRAKSYCVLVSSTNRFNRDYQIKTGNLSQFFSLPGLDGLYQ
ncbi:3'-5' exonuclease [Shewanella algae]|uniref:3'-5' exonuclease n=1 Tax=Shewanella algae TaxID=38313 RepID=UPI001BF139DA|nr:3'-5' exonuclease [Shewanella algae]BCV29044.1 hypothetical protein TUM3811_29040 [Shewanella algae]